LKIFNCGTRFDWYIIKKNLNNETNLTTIQDEENKIININLLNISFIPNKNILKILNYISCDINENISVLKPGSDPRREYIRDVKDEEYKYCLVHSTPKSGVKYKFSKIQKESDHFNIQKIIFGETGINENIVLDIEGVYGCTSSSYGIKIYDIENIELIKKSLLSNDFKIFIESCLWGNYRIDWRLFTYLKKDFWKEFI
jgi:hypothetical protein